jgi:thymidylate synthase
MNVQDIREYFKAELAAERFTQDRNGGKTIEMLGASFLADEPSIFGTVNEEYVASEIDWYLSMSTNINDIYHGQKEPPAAWKMTGDHHGNINSNYGTLVFSNKYFNQFEKALYELINNPDSRRASMIYTRPSIWTEYNENGKSDFICTNSVTYYIRNGKMHCVVQMRSNDVIFGYKNDYAWQRYLLDLMVSNYNASFAEDTFGPLLSSGDIHWQVQNLHVYSRHFHLLGE